MSHSHSNYLVPHKKGFWETFKFWAFTVDHKKIGIMYLVFVMSSFFLGGSFALLVRLELLSPSQILLTAKQYNQTFTLHGIVMVFLFVVPSIPASLGNFFLPLQLGAKDVAFPKLNLASLYFYILGAFVAVYSIVDGAVDTGWTFYTPYSTTTDTSVILMGLGGFIIGFSSILTGLNFIVTTHKLRAPGLNWFKLPLFIWALYATSVIQILATPVLAITLLLLIAEKTLGIGIFTAELGGDPVLFQHFFWFYSHPAVYVMILPAMGVMSELITVFSKKNIFGYNFVAFSSIGIAVISFLVWGHHMFTAQSQYASILFSLLTFLVGIPSAIKIFNWIATLYKGSIELKIPFMWAFAFIFLFTIGGITGIMVAVISIDVHLHDTYFIVAHFHYTMMGGTVMAFFGGIHYWWPKMTGRLYSEKAAWVSFLLVFIGFNVTFFTQFLMGSKGMPRRYYTYLEQFQPYHQISSIGSFMIGAGATFMVIYLIWSIFKGEKANKNPWGALTLEWTHTEVMPIEHNFEETPAVTKGPYEFPSKEQLSKS